MTVEAMALVLHHSRASGTAKVVLLGIANHDGDGGAWPTIATLAKYARVSERTVQRALTDLEELGEVVVHAQAGGTRTTQDRYRPNRYEIRVACPTTCDHTTAHRDTTDVPEPATKTPHETPNRGDAGVTPHAQQGVTPASPLSLVRGDASVASGVTPTSPEPSYNHPGPPNPPPAGGDAAAATRPAATTASPSGRPAGCRCTKNRPGTCRSCRQHSEREAQRATEAARRREAADQAEAQRRARAAAPRPNPDTLAAIRAAVRSTS